MNNEPWYPASFSDSELLIEVRRLTSRECEATAQLVAALGEVDARRLYLGEGCSSLFTYCTQVAAYGRIEAARAAHKWPVLLEPLAEGALHLTAVTLLSRHLTNENYQELFTAAHHKSKREIEEIPVRRLLVRPSPGSGAPRTTRGRPLVSSMIRPLTRSVSEGCCARENGIHNETTSSVSRIARTAR